METLCDWIAKYEMTGECNDSIFLEFASLAKSLPLLKKHKDWVENNSWGFGDTAHHYMWYLIGQHLQTYSSSVHLLEIGVYKGQIISLWALLSRMFEKDFTIHAVSPFVGNRPSRIPHLFKMALSPEYRKQHREGNLYQDSDYLLFNRLIFSRFGLDFSKILIHQGYSSDKKIREEVGKYEYDIIYVDGDHSYTGCLADLESYSPLVKTEGFLVVDDGSCYLPGSMYFKGHEAVSKACEEVPRFGFQNVLNVGHNRVYMRV